MTTTADKMRARVIGLVAKARGTEFDAEREACMGKARELVERYSLSASLLIDPTPQAPSAARAGRPSYTQPERTYPCRFGCGVFVQHTADEMSACAERKRNQTGRDSAYDTAGHTRSSDPFTDFFYTYTGTRRTGHREHASWTRPGGQSASGAYMKDEPKPRTRRQTSHANCHHEPTKSARAHCRKMGGPLR
jgi:hypothetical protein